jgi:hypothetical protein
MSDAIDGLGAAGLPDTEGASEEEKLFAWKFIIPPDKWVKDEASGMEWRGLVFVVVAPTERDARFAAEAYGREKDRNMDWIKLCGGRGDGKLVKMSLYHGRVLCYVEI